MKKYLVHCCALMLPFTPIAATPCAPSSSYSISKVNDENILGEIGFDQLKISNVIVGMLPYEREIPQDLIISTRVTTNFNAVVSTDELDSTVDYVKLADVVQKEAKESKPYFIDVLAATTLERIFNAFEDVESVFIRIEKPKALPNAQSGGIVELTLNRTQFENLSKNEKEPVIAEIGFDKLYLETIIGDLDVERENIQPLVVDLRVSVDIRPLLLNQKFDVNYVELAALFEKVANEGQYYMFETLATLYLKEVYKRYPTIECAHVKINKPGTLPGYPFKNNAITEVKLSKTEIS